MSGSELVAALRTNGECAAARHGYAGAHAEAFLCGWIEEELRNALDAMIAQDAGPYLALLERRFASKPKTENLPT